MYNLTIEEAESVYNYEGNTCGMKELFLVSFIAKHVVSANMSWNVGDL